MAALGLVLNRSRQTPAEHSPGFGAIAERFRRAGELERAVSLCREGLERFPTYVSARVTLGWALLDLGEVAPARAELRMALEQAPDNLAALRGLAELHGREEHNDDEDEQLVLPALTAEMPDGADRQGGPADTPDLEEPGEQPGIVEVARACTPEEPAAMLAQELPAAAVVTDVPMPGAEPLVAVPGDPAGDDDLARLDVELRGRDDFDLDLDALDDFLPGPWPPPSAAALRVEPRAAEGAPMPGDVFEIAMSSLVLERIAPLAGPDEDEAGEADEPLDAFLERIEARRLELLDQTRSA